MSDCSYKNKLQEKFQKRGKSLPKYYTIQRGDKYNPVWISEVELYDGMRIIGSLCKRKIDAENSAAMNALKEIKECETMIKNDYDVSRTVMLIDIENMPKIIDELGETKYMEIYGFVGEHHCLANKKYGEKVNKIISPSNRKDGTDTCMQVFVGYLLTEDKYDTYLIATKDHYGFTLVDVIMSNNFSWKNKIGKVITDISQLSIQK